jgi:hypothetical protein
MPQFWRANQAVRQKSGIDQWLAIFGEVHIIGSLWVYAIGNGLPGKIEIPLPQQAFLYVIVGLQFQPGSQARHCPAERFQV